MPRPAEPTELAALRRSWSRWTAVVESAVRRGRAVDPEVYDRLHKELIAVCQALAAEAGGTKPAYYRRLQDLVEPWLTLKALARTDKEILVHLLSRCRLVERELGGRPWASSAWHRASRGLAWFALVAVLLLVGSIVTWVRLPVLERVQGGWLAVCLAVKHSSAAERLFVAAILVTLAAMYVASRGARR